MRRALLVLIPVLAGCAGRAPYAGRIDALVGQPVARAVEWLGEDYERSATPGGGTTLAWRVEVERVQPGRREPPTVAVDATGAPVYERGRRTPPRLLSLECEVEIDADAAGRIERWRASGAGCSDALGAPPR